MIELAIIIASIILATGISIPSNIKIHIYHTKLPDYKDDKK